MKEDLGIGAAMGAPAGRWKLGENLRPEELCAADLKAYAKSLDELADSRFAGKREEPSRQDRVQGFLAGLCLGLMFCAIVAVVLRG